MSLGREQFVEGCEPIRVDAIVVRKNKSATARVRVLIGGCETS
jgi:hypothetical protein